MTDNLQVFLIFIGAIIALTIFFTFGRELNLWFWGVNKTHKNQERIIKQLENISDKLDDDKPVQNENKIREL
jgi:hypothetical protein